MQRIVTPGTITEEALLDNSSDSILLGVAPNGGYGLAILNLGRGELATLTVAGVDELKAEVARLAPTEILTPAELGSWPTEHSTSMIPCASTPTSATAFSASTPACRTCAASVWSGTTRPSGRRRRC